MIRLYILYILNVTFVEFDCNCVRRLLHYFCTFKVHPLLLSAMLINELGDQKCSLYLPLRLACTHTVL